MLIAIPGKPEQTANQRALLIGEALPVKIAGTVHNTTPLKMPVFRLLIGKEPSAVRQPWLRGLFR